MVMRGRQRFGGKGRNGAHDVLGIGLLGNRRQGTGEGFGDPADDDSREQLGVVVGGDLAGVHSQPQQLGHLVAVEPAMGEALGVDERVDGLVDQRPCEAPVAQCGRGVGLHDRAEARGEGGGTVPASCIAVSSRWACTRKTSTNSSALDEKWRYRAPAETPARSAIAATEAAA